MKQVLTIGPDYHTLKGGIASVLSVYADYDKNFTFLPTYSSENNIVNILISPVKFFNIVWFLLTHPNYKIVHIHGASRISFYRKYLLFITLKYIVRRKVIYHIHGGEYHEFIDESSLITKFYIRHILEKSDAVICLSVQWFDFFDKYYNIKNLYILNNIVSLPLKRSTKNDDDKRITFLLLGRIETRKGMFDLLEMIKNHKDYFNNKVIVKIGGDGEIEKLQNMIHEYRLETIVEYVGWVSGERKLDLLNKSDIYILPSYNEGLPISILEAMSFKMPIISTDVGGISTIVKNDENGKLIMPGEQEALFEAMKFFVEHQEVIPQYGDISFQWVQDFFPEMVISNLHKIYDNVMKG